MNQLWEATPMYQPDPNAPDDDFGCEYRKAQAQKVVRQWAKPDAYKRRFVAQLRRISLLNRLYSLSLWVACGSIIAAVLVCQNDAALKPMAAIVGICAGVHILMRSLLSMAWDKLRRIQRGRE